MEVVDICFDPMGAAMLDDVIYPGNTVLIGIMNISVNIALGKIPLGEDIHSTVESCCVNLLRDWLSCL